MSKYLDFEARFTTDEVRVEESTIIGDGLKSVVKLPHRVKRIPMGELVREYTELLQNKPKRFVLGIIPNGAYSFEIIDWEHLEKKIRGLLNSTGSIEWTY